MRKWMNSFRVDVRLFLSYHVEGAKDRREAESYAVANALKEYYEFDGNVLRMIPIGKTKAEVLKK